MTGAPKPDDDSLTLDDQPQPDPSGVVHHEDDERPLGIRAVDEDRPVVAKLPPRPKRPSSTPIWPAGGAAIQMPPSRPKKPALGPQDGFGAPPDVQRAASDRPRGLTQP